MSTTSERRRNRHGATTAKKETPGERRLRMLADIDDLLGRIDDSLAPAPLEVL